MTAEEKIKNTKGSILEAANVLFAKNGFSGASIRDIAETANVNLAAINYHFKNKENLYWNVFNYNYDWMKKGIGELGEKDTNTAEFAVEVFQFFVLSGSAIMNTFKIFLSDKVAIPEGREFLDEERLGPPGQEAFLKKIKDDLGEEISENGQKWAMKMIFSVLVHFGVMMNTSVMKEKCQTQDDYKLEAIEKSIYHMVLSHLAYLRNNPTLYMDLDPSHDSKLINSYSLKKF